MSAPINHTAVVDPATQPTNVPAAPTGQPQQTTGQMKVSYVWSIADMIGSTRASLRCKLHYSTFGLKADRR
jgi:hypothetical protein